MTPSVAQRYAAIVKLTPEKRKSFPSPFKFL